MQKRKTSKRIKVTTSSDNDILIFYSHYNLVELLSQQKHLARNEPLQVEEARIKMESKNPAIPSTEIADKMPTCFKGVGLGSFKLQNAIQVTIKLDSLLNRTAEKRFHLHNDFYLSNTNLVNNSYFIIDKEMKTLFEIRFYDLPLLSQRGKRALVCKSNRLYAEDNANHLVINMIFDLYIPEVCLEKIGGVLAYKLDRKSFEVLFGRGKSIAEEFDLVKFLELMIPDPDEIDAVFPDIPGLKCVLYQFQKNTVNWMLKREGIGNQTDESDCRWTRDEYFKINICRSLFSFTPNVISPIKREFLNLGGILSEEMGLGKTVEIMAITILHQRPNRAPCPQGLLPSKATLIVTPSSILKQWLMEFQSKTPDLRVYHYTGMVKMKGIEMKDLCDYDVIVADYQIMRRELHFVRPDSDRSRRTERRYERPKSMFTALDFWRLCIDEAQMVDCNSNVGEVASAISRRITWAITGTPLSITTAERDLLNLSHIIDIRELFNGCKNDLYAIHDLFRIYMRRNTKASLGLQIKIPKQHENLVLLQMNKIERTYYNSLKERMYQELSKSGNFDSETDIKQLNSWLLRLRQTCCHLQVGSYNQELLGQEVTSLPVLLCKMISSKKLEIRKSMRQLYSDCIYSGMILESQKRWPEVLPVYSKLKQEIFAFVDGPECNFETEDDDDANVNMKFSINCLRHQIMFCLASVQLELGMKQEADLEFEEAEKVRKAIMKSRENEVLSAVKNAKDYLNLGEFERKWKENHPLSELHVDGGISAKFALESANQLVEFLNKQAEQILWYRSKVIEIAFGELHKEYSEDAERQLYGGLCLNHYLMSIHIRKRVSTLFPVFETIPPQLGADYHQRPRALEEGGELTADGTKIPPEPLGIDDCIETMRSLYLRLRGKMDDLDTSRAEKVFIQQIMANISELSKKEMEFTNILDADLSKFSRLWNKRIEFYRQLQKLSDDVAIPEITDPEQASERIEKAIKITEKQVELLRSQLTYLENLQKEQDSDIVEFSDNICSICYDQLSRNSMIAMTPCFHIFCLTCCSWIKLHKKCPSCNYKFQSNEALKEISVKPNLSLKSQSVTDALDEHARELKSLGPFEHFPFPQHLPVLSQSYGTKIETILKHIKYLIAQDPIGFKCLLFSQWNQMLQIFEKAFRRDNIPFVNFSLAKKSDGVAEVFKSDPTIKVLLMNSKSQSSGLTVTQATHVFLVEPTLNPVLEWQAKGRVHRLGQSKETWIHRYITMQTVEEEIFRIRCEREKTVNSLQFDPMRVKDIADDSAGQDDVVYLLNKELDEMLPLEIS